MKGKAGHLTLLPRPLVAAEETSRHDWQLLDVRTGPSEVICRRCAMHAYVGDDRLLCLVATCDPRFPAPPRCPGGAA